MKSLCAELGILIVVLARIFPASIVKADVVAYWSFDDSDLYHVREERGGKDGAVVGNPERVDGRIGGALKFDGDGGYSLTPFAPVSEGYLWALDDVDGSGALAATVGDGEGFYDADGDGVWEETDDALSIGICESHVIDLILREVTE